MGHIKRVRSVVKQDGHYSRAMTSKEGGLKWYFFSNHIQAFCTAIVNRSFNFATQRQNWPMRTKRL